MKTQIRTAKGRDIPVLADLARRTFREAFTEIPPATLDRYIAEAFNDSDIEAAIHEEGSRFLLAFCREELVGYARVRYNRPPVDIPKPATYELQRLYVDSQFTRNGVGSTLLAASLKEAGALGIRDIWLAVWSANLPARRFYERAGFEVCGSFTHNIAGAEFEGLVMVRAVTPLVHSQL